MRNAIWPAAVAMQRYNLETDMADCDAAAKNVWEALDAGQREVLRQLLFTGPVWDGNVVSKAPRDDLLSLGLAVRVCYMGEQGYTAATYPAFSVFREGGGEPIPARQAVRG